MATASLHDITGSLSKTGSHINSIYSVELSDKPFSGQVKIYYVLFSVHPAQHNGIVLHGMWLVE